MLGDLFADFDKGHVALGPDALVLRNFAIPYVDDLLNAIDGVGRSAPFRQMVTPGGYSMSVAMTNFGPLGWTTDKRGYRYTTHDPQNGLPWPIMPMALYTLARSAADAAGFEEFNPDACLVNRYQRSARLSLHQDKNEHDMKAPIVSVSLGMTATFLFGGLDRSSETKRICLHHGDVAVWGGRDRLRYHGVMPLRGPAHDLVGAQRINLTFRKAGRPET